MPGLVNNYHMSFLEDGGGGAGGGAGGGGGGGGGGTSSSTHTSSLTSSSSSSSLTSTSSSSNSGGGASSSRRSGAKVVFLYRLVRGHCPRSFGINVARLAGVPPRVLEVAARKAEEIRTMDEMKNKAIAGMMAKRVVNALENVAETKGSGGGSSQVQVQELKELRQDAASYLFGSRQ